jgi:release factor H-coupled RctB family protein
LLVHNGSRGLGESILRDLIDRFKADGLMENTLAADEYRVKHNSAVEWAKANRKLISQRFLGVLGTEGKFITDVCPNSVSAINYNDCQCWLHRKGAAPGNEVPVIIPGSRGTYS